MPDSTERLNELKENLRASMEADVRERSEESKRIVAELREMLEEARRTPALRVMEK